MVNDHSRETHASRRGGAPLVVAIVIAILGILGILIVDYGPWNKPHLKTAEVANTSATGDAARDAGATVIPSEPKRRLEPDAPGPEPVHPANPATPPQDF
jgi:hypothetical protein